MNKKILATLDLSPSSIQVLNIAVQFASLVNGNLIIANVISKREIAIVKNIWNIYSSLDNRDLEAIKKIWEIGPLKNEYRFGQESSETAYNKTHWDVDCVESIGQERKNMIRDMLREIQAENIGAEVVIPRGNPYKELLNIVKKRYIDIVVTGPKGKSNPINALFGTFPERLYHNCPAQVVSVRTREFTNRKNFKGLQTIHSLPARPCERKESEEKSLSGEALG